MQRLMQIATTQLVHSCYTHKDSRPYITITAPGARAGMARGGVKSTPTCQRAETTSAWFHRRCSVTLKYCNSPASTYEHMGDIPTNPYPYRASYAWGVLLSELCGTICKQRYPSVVREDFLTEQLPAADAFLKARTSIECYVNGKYIAQIAWGGSIGESMRYEIGRSQPIWSKWFGKMACSKENKFLSADNNTNENDEIEPWALFQSNIRLIWP
ncbi:hypothetical protein CBL_10428 [Carabus blaptoides fortunei]